MTSRLETFRYQKFSQFFESIRISLENFVSKKSQYRSRRKKTAISLKKKLSKKKSVYRSRKKVSVSASKKFSLKKSWYRFRNFLSQKKSWCWSQKLWYSNGLKDFGFPTSPNMSNHEQDIWNVHHVINIKKMPLKVGNFVSKNVHTPSWQGAKQISGKSMSNYCPALALTKFWLEWRAKSVKIPNQWQWHVWSFCWGCCCCCWYC